MTELSEPKKFQLPKISETAFLTIVGILLPFAGFIKSIIYYDMFGISIAGFLDFSEILTLFVSDLLLYFSIFVGIALIEYYSWHNNSVNKVANIIGQLLMYAVTIFVLCYLIKLLNIGWLNRLFHFAWIDEKLSQKVSTDSYYRFMIGLMFTCYILSGFVSSADDAAIQLFKIISKLLLLFGVLFFHGRYTAYKVYSGITKLPVASITKSDHSIIQISRDTIYLGKTKDYYFLFPKKTNQAIAIKAEEVASVTMRTASALEFHFSEDSLHNSAPK